MNAAAASRASTKFRPPLGRVWDLAAEKIQHRFCRAEPLVVRTKQQRRIQDHELSSVTVEILDRGTLLIILRRVIRPSRKDIDRLRKRLVDDLVHPR